MNYGLILAGGVGQRMRNSGMPKQFLEVFRKPIIIYTLEKFEKCADIDKVVIACNPGWIDHMNNLLQQYQIRKVIDVLPGGKNRQSSVHNGMLCIQRNGGRDDDIIVIHDGVRPLVECSIISENVRVAKKYGCAMTVRPAIESVCVCDGNEAGFDDFQKRDDTYQLTAPQSFTLKILRETTERTDGVTEPIPILDPAIGYAFLGNKIHLVKENNQNIKITTPEDYYILKAMLELEENRYVFGL